MVKDGKSAKEIAEWLTETGKLSSIYIMVNTLKYLKKGGRLTPAVAMIGTLLKIKPVLQIQGAKLDQFAKPRNFNKAKEIMINAVKDDLATRFAEYKGKMKLTIAYTDKNDEALIFKKEVEEAFGMPVEFVDPPLPQRFLPHRPGRACTCLLHKLTDFKNYYSRTPFGEFFCRI